MKRISLLLAFAMAGAAMAEDPDLAKARGPLIADLVRQLRTPIDLGECMPRTTDGNRARELLVAIGKPAIPALIQVLKEDNEWARLSATRALQELAAKEALPTLIELYEKTEEPVLKATLLESIAHLGDQQATPLILRAIETSDDYVQALQIKLLGFTRDPKVIPVLEMFAFEPLEPNGELTARSSCAIESLASLKAIDVLMKALTSESAPLRKQVAKIVLGQTDRAFDPLIQCVLESAEVRTGEMSFAWSVHPLAREAAIVMLKSGDVIHQARVVEGLEEARLAIDTASLLERKLPPKS